MNACVSLFVAGVAILAQTEAEPPADAPTPQQIAQAIEELGDDDFGVRQQASLKLWRAGQAAEKELWTAAESVDPEVAMRARRILRNFRYGIYPDTPDDVLQSINQFRFGAEDARQAVLRQLVEKQRLDTVMTLLRTVDDAQQRQQLTAGLLRGIEKLAGPMFVSGDWQRVEALLRLGAVSDEGMRNYAAYLAMRGRLEPAVASLRKQFDRQPHPLDAELLAYLLRASGDLPAARQMAEAAGNAELIAGLDLEAGDWPKLADACDEACRDAAGTLRGGIVELGELAAFHRLAGNAKGADEAAAAIVALARRKPNKLWYCVEALLINGRYDEALTLCREDRPTAAFDLLCVQSRPIDALRLAGYDLSASSRRPWFTSRGAGAEDEAPWRSDRLAEGLKAAGLLARLGESSTAKTLLEELAPVAIEQQGSLLRRLCFVEYAAGFHDAAWDHAAAALQDRSGTAVLGAFYPSRADAAEAWWELFRERYPQETSQATLARVRQVMAPARDGALDRQEWLELVEQYEAAAAKLSPSSRSQRLIALADTCLDRGEDELAREYVEKAAAVAPAVPVLLRIGDMAAAREDWLGAAEHYDRAWQHDRTRPTALYLRGWALMHAGQSREAERLMEAARLLPMGNAETRYELAEDLARRGLMDGAAEQWQWIVRTGELQARPTVEAGDRLADRIDATEPARAADYRQRLLLRCLQASSGDFTVADFLRRAWQIHLGRARAGLAAGNVDEALAEIRRAEAALPGEVETAVALVPPLQQSGLDAEAERLFSALWQRNEQICDAFPASAEHHGQLAWLGARCGRRLEEAEWHAAKAVELAPENLYHQSTLAEVHFSLGCREKAVATLRPCLNELPDEKRFSEQATRFDRQGD